MYFTDRGIEELQARRGEEEVSIAWLAERLREQAVVDAGRGVDHHRHPRHRPVHAR